MTFPLVLKKSGPITVSKTGLGSSKTSSPESPKSPGSPLNMSSKSSGLSSKAPLAKAPVKTNIVTSVKRLPVSPKSPALKTASKPVIDDKSVSAKTVPISTTKEVTKKSVTKPPPLKLNIVTISNGLQSPTTPKSTSKTPTTPSEKSLGLNKSPALTAKSTSLTTRPVTSPPPPKIVNIGVKSSTTSPLSVKSTSKSSISSPDILKVSALSKTSTTSTVPKSPLLTNKLSNPTSKSVIAKTIVKNSSISSTPVQSKTNIVKPITPVKKVAVPTKSIIGVKSPITTTIKSTMISKSPSKTTILKSNPLKTSTSPLKLLNEDPNAVKEISSKLINVSSKSSTISKTEPASPKVIKKESSTLSSVSVKSYSSIKSTSIVSKTTTLKDKVTTSTVSKNLIPKSPVPKTLRLTVGKTPSSPSVKNPSSPIIKTPISPIVKIPLSQAVKTKTPSSPTVRPRTTSISAAKPPISPAKPKLLPTKLILSPIKNKLSTSKLNSASTESLASRSMLKSPMSPKPIKFVPKSSLKVAKKTETPIEFGIRGQQPIKKTIVIPGITELSSNQIVNTQETGDVNCNLENILEKDTDLTVQSDAPQELEISHTINNIIDSIESTNEFVFEYTPSNIIDAKNDNQLVVIQEQHSETLEEDSNLLFSSITPMKQKQDEDNCSLDFEFVKEDECVPSLNNIFQSENNSSIVFDDNHFNETNAHVTAEHFDGTQSCITDSEYHFEPMNDKLVLGDVPFETDSNQSDNSDSEQTASKEIPEIVNPGVVQENRVEITFFSIDDSLKNDLDTDNSKHTENFIYQFMPKSIERCDASSISTDDGSIPSRKSYSEAVVGSPKDGEYYFDYDIDFADDCLDYDDERSVFVEVTEKEFPELKPKDLSGKRKNKKQKKRNFSNRTDSQSDSNNSLKMHYNPEDFNGSEFCHYINIMKDCSFYPNGLFSSDSVKLSTSSSLSWLDISVRTTDDDLVPSTECLNTYEIFQASNLNKDFLMSIIGCSTGTPSTNETSWFWKSIEGKHQSHNKTNITLCLQPRPKHLDTPRFMTLLALISEAKGYDIKPALSEHFVTSDCMSRFDEKIRRFMVQGFWFIGRLINESLSKDEEVNCGNPFEFVDGDIGYWWAGVHMLDWQEYIKECDKSQSLPNCYQFTMDNMEIKRHNSKEAIINMGADPDDFMSELDVENFIHTVRHVKYYCGNFFVDNQENLEIMNEVCNDDDSLIEWENSTAEEQH